MFHFQKTFCYRFTFINTKQNVHFTTKKIEVMPIDRNNLPALNIYIYRFLDERRGLLDEYFIFFKRASRFFKRASRF